MLNMRYLTLVFLTVLFFSCSQENVVEPADPETPVEPVPTPNKPNDVTIPIDENSSFNMKNFIISFEQLFTPYERWEWGFTHDFNEEGIASSSYHDYKIYGEFGDKAKTFTHIFDDKGVIISSNLVSNIYPEDVVKYEYEYDQEGFVIKMTAIEERVNEIEEEHFYFEYNAAHQLVKMTRKDGDYIQTFSFTYNEDGFISLLRSEEGENSEAWRESKQVYTDGNMTASYVEHKSGHKYTDTYIYDNQSRVINITQVTEESTSRTYETIIEYSSTIMSVFNSSIEGDVLSKTDYGVNYTKLRQFRYFIDPETTDFLYCRVEEYDDKRKASKISYNEGSIDELELIGYTNIDSRNTASKGKTKETIYSAADEKLYYVEYTYEGYSYYPSVTKWFTADGVEIEESDIQEDWVFILVK